MNKQDAGKILEILVDLYPKFHINETVAKAWMYSLKKGDYELTQKKLLKYYEESRFEPKPSDIIVIKRVNQAQLQYEEIQQAVERNKRTEDPKRRAELLARLDRLRSELNE
ncbi:hypothetical protein [Macrococcoides caseolyticum]|uniref:Uncharacterized protein n=1 Tax=Macrococcoides caseolyticum TaxID=69966 RepID=A0ACC9MPT5_9STAP|nr:hypothetical protein [Macrococcus caseolyticus]PKE55491.1 hypothetical protein CW682_11745 [Macrococcus caseolyticus]